MPEVTQQATVVKIMNSGMRLPAFGPYFCHLLLCDFGLVTLSLGFSFLISRMCGTKTHITGLLKDETN